MPRAFSDIEAAARWLGGPSDRRPWLVFERERLPELNAAFRSISTGKNLVLLDPVTSNVIVATNRHYPGESQHNPLAADVLQQVPRLAHDTSLEFGSVFRLTGWDIKNEAGTSVSQLVPGVAYELQLAFQVLGTTAIDWQIFVHVDGRGRRHNADHDPVSNRYPTTLWQRGDAIVDRHKLVLERGTLPGPHTLYFGFFRGSRRLDVTVGEHEDNRVKLGQLEIR